MFIRSLGWKEEGYTGGRFVLSAYKIINAVIPERVDDSPTDRYLIVAPEDRIIWVTTSEPEDLTPEGRKNAVHQAGLFSLLNKLKNEENAVESEDLVDTNEYNEGLTEGDFSEILGMDSNEEYDDSEDDTIEAIESWELEKH
jgi:hypothetical protein